MEFFFAGNEYAAGKIAARCKQITMSKEPIITPCNQKCDMDPKTGYCLGCCRNLDEIIGWGLMSQKERKHFMEVIMPNRREQMKA